MQFALSALLLSSIASAAPIYGQGDMESAQAAAAPPGNNLNGGIQKTDKDVVSFRGDANGATLVLQDSAHLLDDLRSGSASIARSAQVSLLDRPDWLAPAYNLDRNLDRLTTTLIAKKAQFEKAGKANDMAGQLMQIKSATDELVKNIFSKLPSASQLVARPVSNQIVGKVDKAIDAFQGKTWNPIAGGPAIPKPFMGTQPSGAPASSTGGSWWGGSAPSQPAAAAGGASSPPAWSSGPAPASAPAPAPAAQPQQQQQQQPASAAPDGWSNSAPPQSGPVNAGSQSQGGWSNAPPAKANGGWGS